MECMLQRARKVSRLFVEEFCELHEKKIEKTERKRKTDRDLYDVEVVELDTTRKKLKIHFVGLSHANTMNGVIIIFDNESNYFPFVCLEKMFFPQGRFGGMRIEATFFLGQLYSLHHLFFLAEPFLLLRR